MNSSRLRGSLSRIDGNSFLALEKAESLIGIHLVISVLCALALDMQLSISLWWRQS